MPARNSRKIYVRNGIYHVYNRGVEKRVIFSDNQDFKVFTGYLKEYLSLPQNSISSLVQGQALQKRSHKNFSEKIELMAYCLMPNHFHLMLCSLDEDSLKNLMKSISTRYSMYFNKKYDRVGPLFQDRYKAVLVENEAYLLHLSRYIHLNPYEFTDNLLNTYSSYSSYLKIKRDEWIKPDKILSYFKDKKSTDFKRINSYKDFVEKYKKDSKLVLGNLILE